MPIDASGETAGEAIAAARDWVQVHGRQLPGFSGAWLAGSVAWQPPAAHHPPWSDVDVMLLLDDTTLPPKPGKLRHQGVLLEISFVPVTALKPVDRLSANYRLSASFVRAPILADPTGNLTALQSALARDYALPGALADRRRQVREATIAGLHSAESNRGSLADRAQWVFPAGLPTHLLLLAMGENPTVRRRYEKVQPLLVGAGREELYEALLSATGYADLSRTEMHRYWQATSHLFDLAATISHQSDRFFATDISATARPISIDGTRDSIDRGFHREAAFWLIATQARSLMILEDLAPDLITDDVACTFTDLITRTGIATSRGMRARSQAIISLLPELERVSLERAADRSAVLP